MKDHIADANKMVDQAQKLANLLYECIAVDTQDQRDYIYNHVDWDKLISNVRKEVEEKCTDRAMTVAKRYILDRPVGSKHQVFLAETIYRHKLTKDNT